MRHALRATFLMFTALEFSGVASAADLPVKVKAPPVPVYYNWTGVYAGVNLGGSWGRQCAEIFDGGFPVASDCVHPNGVIGGGQIGYNWQFAPWFGWGNAVVLGLEGDFQGSNQKTDENFGFGRFTFNGTTFPAVAGTFTDRLEWFGTIRGRVGVAFDRVLPYVTGGWAFGHRTIDIDGFSTSTTMTDGWTAGGGVEWAFWQNWTAKFEYLYIDFGNKSPDLSAATFSFPTVLSITNDHFRDHIGRVGVNYKF
jgi:outer membrane immunogenic protein